MAQDMERLVVGVDVGGTNVRSALVNERGQVLLRAREPTCARRGVEVVLGQISRAIEKTLTEAERGVEGIGLACAGIIDMEKGIVTTSPNIPEFQDFPVKQKIEERFGLPTCLLNDACAAALGEHTFGAGRGFHHLLYLTVSTGIGGGIIADDRLYLGAQGAAGEVGHQVIEAEGPRCHCGSRGCLEALASGWAIAREAKERGLKSGGGAFRSRPITAEMVHRWARAGDPVALEVIARAGEYLGIGLANLVNLFNPQLLILGGGVAKMGELLLGPAERALHERAFALPAGIVRMVPPALGEDSGLLGVAVWFFRGEGK